MIPGEDVSAPRAPGLNFSLIPRSANPGRVTGERNANLVGRGRICVRWAVRRIGLAPKGDDERLKWEVAVMGQGI